MRKLGFMGSVLIALAFLQPATLAIAQEQEVCAPAVFTPALPQSFAPGTVIPFTVDFGMAFSEVHRVTTTATFPADDPFGPDGSIYMEKFGGYGIRGVAHTTRILTSTDPLTLRRFRAGRFESSYLNWGFVDFPPNPTDHFTLESLQFCLVGVPAAPGANVPPIAECRGLGLPVYDTCQVMVDINGGSYDPDGSPQPLTFVQDPPPPYGPGIRIVTLTVSDGADSDTCTAGVSIFDSAPPVFPDCREINVDATPGLGGAYVSYDLTASDTCDGSLPMTCNIPDGSFFPVGQNQWVTCTATDSSGNTGTCRFPVDVHGRTTCQAAAPESQDYWRTQCNYRAPDGTPPDPDLTFDVLQELLDGVEADLQAVCGPTESTCRALNPDPYWDICEQACQEYAGVLLNIASALLPPSCCTLEGTVAEAADRVAELIMAGQCDEAASIAYELNRGCLFCED